MFGSYCSCCMRIDLWSYSFCVFSTVTTRSMFTSGLTESSQREVRIVGVESESMHLVLDYAYTSRVTLSESNVQALFTAASIFQIPALQDQCAQFMISRLDPQNSIGVYMFADAYGHQELRERSQDYIRKKVSNKTGWVSYNAPGPTWNYCSSSSFFTTSKF